MHLKTTRVPRSYCYLCLCVGGVTALYNVFATVTAHLSNGA